MINVMFFLLANRAFSSSMEGVNSKTSKFKLPSPPLYDNPLNPSLVVKVWHSFPIIFLLFDDTYNKKRQAEKGICHGIHCPNWQTLCSN